LMYDEMDEARVLSVRPLGIFVRKSEV